MRIKNPLRADPLVRRKWMGDLRFGVTEAAHRLGINRKQASGTGRCGSRIQLGTAIALDGAFGEASDSWDGAPEQTKKSARHTKVEQVLTTT